MKLRVVDGTESPLRIAIVGDGIDAAVTAATLARFLPKHRFALTAVPGPVDQQEPFGAVEATLPSVRHFHGQLGLEEADLIAKRGASFTLGNAYSGFSRGRPAYFVPHGDIGAALNGVAFHHLAARLRATGAEVRLSDYSLATLLAQAGRFTQPSDDPRSPLSTYTYGLHLPSAEYQAVLWRSAERDGIDRRAARLRAVEFTAEGAIGSVTTDDGSKLSADFFIDATASEAALVSAMPGSGFDSWKQWLPCDRSVTITAPTEIPAAPYALAQALECGWRRTVPAQGVVSDTIVYSADHGSAETIDQLVGNSGDEHHAAFEQGRQNQPWLHNCLAIGEAAAVLEPLHPRRHDLLIKGVERLLKLLPSGMPAAIESREYNRLTTQELDRARDFAILRYQIAGAHGTLWDAARAADPPEALASKLTAFGTRGRLPMLDGDGEEEESWALVIGENGIQPSRYDVLADAAPLPALQQQFARMRETLIRAAAAQPKHGDYLESIRAKAAA